MSLVTQWHLRYSLVSITQPNHCPLAKHQHILSELRRQTSCAKRRQSDLSDTCETNARDDNTELLKPRLWTLLEPIDSLFEMTDFILSLNNIT